MDDANDASLEQGLIPSAPEPLAAHHAVTDFDCRTASLSDWLKRRALRNQVSGASRTFVVCDDRRVVAYYAPASSAVALDSATGKLRRNMPAPILQRPGQGALAVDAHHYRALYAGFGQPLGATDGQVLAALVTVLDQPVSVFASPQCLLQGVQH